MSNVDQPVSVGPALVAVPHTFENPACRQAAALHSTASLRPWAGWLGVLIGCACVVFARGSDGNEQKLQADGVEVRLRVAPTQTTTAGRIVAEVEVIAPTATMIELAPPVPQPIGQLTVVSAVNRGPDMLRPGVMTYSLRAVFTPFLGGTYDVPAFTVAYRSSATAGQLVTQPVPVLVKSVIDGDPAVAMPAGILALDATPLSRSWLRFAGLAVVVVVIALAGWLFFRRRRRSTANVAPVLGPCASALAALEANPAPDASSLEQVIESLHTHDSEPLPNALRHPYQWIRFGSPMAREVDEFTAALKEYLREQARLETPGEVAPRHVGRNPRNPRALSLSSYSSSFSQIRSGTREKEKD